MLAIGNEIVEYPKYTLETDWELNRWILEKWIKTDTPELDGRYGYYEFSHLLQTPMGNFLPLTRDYLQLVVTLIEKGKDYSFEEHKAAILQRHQEADEAARKRRSDILDEAMHEARLHIGMNPSCLNDVKITHGIENPRAGMHQSSKTPLETEKLRRL